MCRILYLNTGPGPRGWFRMLAPSFLGTSNDYLSVQGHNRLPKPLTDLQDLNIREVAVSE